jgi:hypothetical protein
MLVQTCGGGGGVSRSVECLFSIPPGEGRGDATSVSCLFSNNSQEEQEQKRRRKRRFNSGRVLVLNTSPASDGPAGMSMDTIASLPCIIIFAAVW